MPLPVHVVHMQLFRKVMAISMDSLWTSETPPPPARENLEASITRLNNASPEVNVNDVFACFVSLNADATQPQANALSMALLSGAASSNDEVANMASLALCLISFAPDPKVHIYTTGNKGSGVPL